MHACMDVPECPPTPPPPGPGTRAAQRTVLNAFRNPAIVFSQWTVVLVFAAIVGAIYWKPKQDTSGVQDLLGGFFFITMLTVRSFE